MIVSIKTLEQKSFQIEVDPSILIRDLKTKIHELQGCPVAQQKLIHSGKILSDEKELGFYNITEKDFLVLMVTKVKAAPTPKPDPVPLTSQPAVPKETPVVPVVNPVSSAAPTTAINPSALATGSEYEVAVQNLCDMGFEKDQVKAAMRAAFNNPDRAAEYLMTGIPSNLGPAENAAAQGTPAQSAPPTNPANLFEAAAQAANAPPSTNPGEINTSLDFLRNSPQFQELRELVQSQPHLIQPLLQQLGQSNPELLQMINGNREAFMQMLGETGEPGEEGYEEAPPHSQYITVTPEENEAIMRLVSLGFDRVLAVEAYFACDKNEELAANYLFDSMNFN